MQLVAKTLRTRLVSQINACPFYTIIVDTTSNITRTDQVSIVIRWACIEGESVLINETFMGFASVSDFTAVGLTDVVSKWLFGTQSGLA